MARGDRRTLLAEMRLEQAQANYVRKVLGDSAKEIEERLAKIGTSGNPLTRMQLEAQRSAIKSMLDQDFKDIEKSIAAGKIDAAKTASKVVSQYENQLLKAVVSQDVMRRIARSEAQRTVNNLEAALKRMKGASYKPLSKQVYKTKQLSAGWVDDIINKALVSGWSAQQLAKAVVPSISPNVPGGVSYAANRLARTEINNAYHAASWDRYNRSAIVEEVEWLLSSSHPEDDICNDYALESPFKKNAVPAKPHPNCYCYIVPRLPTEEEFLSRLFAGEYGDEPWVEEINKPVMDPAAADKLLASVKRSYYQRTKQEIRDSDLWPTVQQAMKGSSSALDKLWESSLLSHNQYSAFQKAIKKAGIVQDAATATKTAAKISTAATRPPITQKVNYKQYGYDDVPNQYKALQAGRISERQSKSVGAYVGEEFAPINEYLRTGKGGHRVQAYVDDIDAVMKKSTLTNGGMVERGQGLDEWAEAIGYDPRNPQAVVGKSWRSDGYLSTSVRDDLFDADEFEFKQLQMEIHVAPGTKGFTVNRFTDIPGERELLLDRGLNLTVTKIEVGDDGMVYIKAIASGGKNQ